MPGSGLQRTAVRGGPTIAVMLVVGAWVVLWFGVIFPLTGMYDPPHRPPPTTGARAHR